MWKFESLFVCLSFSHTLWVCVCVCMCICVCGVGDENPNLEHTSTITEKYCWRQNWDAGTETNSQRWRAGESTGYHGVFPDLQGQWWAPDFSVSPLACFENHTSWSGLQSFSVLRLSYLQRKEFSFFYFLGWWFQSLSRWWWFLGFCWRPASRSYDGREVETRTDMPKRRGNVSLRKAASLQQCGWWQVHINHCLGEGPLSSPLKKASPINIVRLSLKFQPELKPYWILNNVRGLATGLGLPGKLVNTPELARLLQVSLYMELILQWALSSCS